MARVNTYLSFQGQEEAAFTEARSSRGKGCPTL